MAEQPEKFQANGEPLSYSQLLDRVESFTRFAALRAARAARSARLRELLSARRI